MQVINLMNITIVRIETTTESRKPRNFIFSLEIMLESLKILPLKKAELVDCTVSGSAYDCTSGIEKLLSSRHINYK